MRLGIALAVTIAIAAPATGHDFFIEPSAHRVKVGESLTATLWVGAPDELDEIPRSNRRIVRFEAHHGDKVVPIEGKHGSSPAGTIAFDKPGIAQLVYESTHSYVELEPAKFGAYLKEEGLDDIFELRKREGLEPIPGRESYARYVKSLISVGDAPAPEGINTSFRKPIGLPFEIVAISDPRKAGPAAFLVLYDGKPRGNARVDLLRVDKKAKGVVSVAHGRTDIDGYVTLEIPGNGRWIAATTAMRKAPPELQLEGEWESLWSSITFETGKPKKTGGCATTDPSLFVALGMLTFLLARMRVRARRDP